MNKKILLTGGGTAGHCTPNLALIPYLEKEGMEVVYIGTKNGIEREIITNAGIKYYPISAGKLRRYFSLKNFSDPFKIIAGYFQAKKIIKKEKPCLVFSKGGFVTVPVVFAAKSRHVPVVLHESDYTPGLANRLCIPKADKVCVSFEAAAKHIEKDKAVIIIFITNMAEYAIQGYDVEARGFILKPVRYRLFSQQMDRALRELESKKVEYLSLQFPTGVRNVGLKDIFYMENREHYLHIHLEHEIITFYCTIKEMEKRLEGKPFFRCNSGLIVNLAKVQSVRNNEIQIHGETLTVSRSRKKEFMELLTEYMGEGEYV